MSETPHCFATRNGCKMLEIFDLTLPEIREFNQFLRIPIGKITESIGHGSGLIGKSDFTGKTARNVHKKIAGCTIGVSECIQ